MADKLFITIDTVKSLQGYHFATWNKLGALGAHRKHIMEKSGCANMAELSARSVSSGWI